MSNKINKLIALSAVLLAVLNVGSGAWAQVYRVSTLTGKLGRTTNFPNGTLSTAAYDKPVAITNDASGNFYVAEITDHRIRKIATDGTVTTFAGASGGGYADGTGTAARFNNPFGLAVDASGNIFVADMYNHRIRKITPAGVVSTFAGSGTASFTNGTGTAATFNQPADLRFDASGNLFVVDEGNHAIRKITPAGVVTTYAGTGTAGLVNGAAASAKFNDPIGLAVDPSGNVFVADQGNWVVRKIATNGTVSTFCGSGQGGTGNGAASVAQFNNPMGSMAADAAGNIIIAEKYNSQVRRMAPDGTISLVAGSTNGYVNGTGSAAAFYQCRSVTISASGDYYVVEQGSNIIRKVTPAGVTSTFSGMSTTNFADGPLDYARFNLPMGIAVDASNNLYVADYSNIKVRKISAAGIVSTLAGSGAQGDNDGNGSQAWFRGPMDCEMDASGNVFVTDQTNNSIRKITQNGDVTTVAGSFLNAGFVNGTGTSAQFRGPNGLGRDPATGNFYIADAGAVRKMTPGTYVVTTAAGTGTGGFSNNTNPLLATFNGLLDAAVDASGNIYVTETTNHCIRKIATNGTVTTFAGSGTAGNADGTGTAAGFNRPHHICFDLNGNLLVADKDNNKIRKITPAGVVTTLAGTGASSFNDGIATSATFASPSGVAVGADGKIYISDAGNNSVRVIQEALSISSISPNIGAPGTSLTITGYGFSTATSVKINGVTASFSITNNTTIVATVPAGATSGAITIAIPETTVVSTPTLCVPPAQPTISASGATTFCNGGSVTLTASASGATGYIWNDGSTANPRTVSTSGSYSAMAIGTACTSALGTATVVTVNPVPTAGITAGGSTTFCAGGSVTLTATGGNTYLWNDGSTANPRTVTTAGSYSVQAISLGCTSLASSTTVVTVNPVPTVGLTAGGPTTFCAGGSVTLTATGGTSYLWSDGSTSNPRTVSAAGSYTVQAISLGCTSAASSATVVTVNSIPTASINAGGPTTFCDGGSVTLTATGGSSYLWSDGSTANTRTVSANASLSVKAISLGCTSTSSAATVVTVNPIPVAGILASGPTTFCSGDNVTLTATGGTSYLWSDGSTANPRTITANSSLSVKAISLGCTSASSAATVVNVITVPTPGLSAGGVTTFCDGGSVTLTASGGTSYLWSDNSTGATLTATTSGSYSVQSIANGCTSASSSPIVVTVNPIPVATITAGGPTSFSSPGNVVLTAGGGTSYVWSTGAKTASITVTASGSYSVQAIANGCTSAVSAPVGVSVCLNSWTGAVSNDWANAGNWTSGTVPGPTTVITICPTANNRYPIIFGASTATVKDLLISGATTLTIAGTLNVTGNLINNGSLSGAGTLALSGTTSQTISGSNAFLLANLTLNNTAGASLLSPVNISGVVKLQKGNLSSNSNLTIVSGINSTGLIDDFTTGNTGTVTGNVKVQRYMTLGTDPNNAHFVGNPVNGNTCDITGTLVNFWSEALNAQTAAPANYKTLPFTPGTSIIAITNAGNVLTFTGTANTGDVSVDLVRGAGSSPQRGYNAVGNPYPSPISWTSVIASSGLTANSNGTANVWNPITNTYNTITSAGVTTGSATNIIPVGQGFLVRRSTLSSNGTASMVFKNSQRVNTAIATFNRKPVTDQALRLALKSDNSEDDILLYTAADAKVDADDLDAEKLHSHLPVASLSSGDDLAINALPTDFKGTVALNITAPNSGIYTLAVKELADVNVTLEDKKEGTFTTLTPETKLDLNLNTDNTGRFALHYGSGAAKLGNTQIFAADKMVTVILPEAENAIIEAVNTVGQVVSTINSTEKITRFALPHDGVYVIRVKSGSGVNSGKVIY